MRRHCLLFILTGLLLCGCYSEADLIPSDIGSVADKFDFPQGTSQADEMFVDFFERYATKVIYKDFTRMDMDRAWMSVPGGASTEVRWDFITDEALLLEAAKTLEEKVFAFIPDEYLVDYFKSAPYIYLTNNLMLRQMAGFPWDNDGFYTVKALDGITINLEVGAELNNYRRIVYPARLMLDIFAHAYHKGMITMPDSFFENVDRGQFTYSYDQAEVDPTRYLQFWGRQGHIPSTGTRTGRISTSRITTFSSMRSASIEPFNTSNRDAGNFFLYLCLDPNWRKWFEPGNILHDSYRAKERLEQFDTRMREVYGINFDAIRAKLYEGSTIDTSMDRFYDNTDTSIRPPNGETYIYILY